MSINIPFRLKNKKRLWAQVCKCKNSETVLKHDTDIKHDRFDIKTSELNEHRWINAEWLGFKT